VLWGGGGRCCESAEEEQSASRAGERVFRRIVGERIRWKLYIGSGRVCNLWARGRRGWENVRRGQDLVNAHSAHGYYPQRLHFLETFGTALLIHVPFPSICPALVYVSSRLTSNIWGTAVTTMSYLYHVEEKFF